MKYVNTGVVFQEIPDEVTLSINISNCPCHCMGCHSQYLWEDIGEPLNAMSLDVMLKEYGDDITCVAFMGPYIEAKGPLNKPTTNQILYKVNPKAENGIGEDITKKFWKK